MNYSVKLDKNFTMQFNRLQSKYGEEFAYLNGLGDEQLSDTNFLDQFLKTEVVADASIDGNANVGRRDVVTLLKEMDKPKQKLLSFHKIYHEINKKYGYKDANDWLEAEWSKQLYMHDPTTASFLPYCYAYDLKELAEKGLFFIKGINNQPPKHLITFVDFLKEFISYASNRQSGAVGLPNLIPYMYYFWKKDVEAGEIPKNSTPERFAKQNIQRFIYAVNQPYTRDGVQSAFTNTSVFDMPYLEALFGGSEFPDGSFMIDELEGIMQFQKWYMEEMSTIRSTNMFTFPVSTMNFLMNEEMTEFVDKDFAEWAIKHNMKWNDSNIYADNSVTSLSNCCRLKSNIKDLGYFNSIGGTSLRVGSVKVSTINLARIAIEHGKSEEDYLNRLEEVVLLDLKALDSQRYIIKRNIEKNLLTNYREGLIDLKTQYSTIGFMGIYETMKLFGYTHKDELGNTIYDDKAFSFGEKIFDVIHRIKDEFAEDKDYAINLEQVPGEQLAIKFYTADKMLYPKKVVKDLPLYGNQFLPLGIKATLQERVRIAAAFDSYCSGGSILHVNIEAPFTNYDQALKMTKYIIGKGVTYFAFNVKIQSCKNNHAFFGTKCPQCGGDVFTEYTRIVGFYTPIKDWSSQRRDEYKMREWHALEGSDLFG